MRYVDGGFIRVYEFSRALFKSRDEITSSSAPIGQEINKVLHYRGFQCNCSVTVNIHIWSGETKLL
jgi:hypothetical protein